MHTVHFKENLYFTIKLIVTITFYLTIIYFASSGNLQNFYKYSPLTVYILIFMLYILIRHGVLIGYLKGNAIRVTENQFPEIFDIVNAQSKILGLNKTPSIYILQDSGILNAFVTRFFGRDFIVIYSEILEIAYESGNKSLNFIIAHELGHIKRKHCTKNTLLFPSHIIPFLNSAYSRACEYTCDRIGYYLCPEGAISGMLILSAGRKLYSKVNVDEFISTSRKEKGFWKWFTEIISTHPNTPKRIYQFIRHQ